MLNSDELKRVGDVIVNHLSEAENIGVLTGAGISAASGIPTFRGKDGLWKKYRPEELANPYAFSQNPELVWEWYLWRRNLIRKVKPNAAHFALVKMESMFGDVSIITQNVDNLHQRAGSRRVIELHGNIMRSKCSACGNLYDNEVDISGRIPQCPVCGSFIRPDVVWFGEPLPFDALEEARSIARKSQVFLITGTSGVVEPAASIPYWAKSHNAVLIEFNLEPTPLTEICDLYVHAPVDQVLPAVVRMLKEKK
jgi:NAD-dependent deacetylase